MGLAPQLLAEMLLDSVLSRTAPGADPRRDARGAQGPAPVPAVSPAGAAPQPCRGAQALVQGDGSRLGPAAGGRWPGAAGGSHPCSPCRRSRQAPERPPTVGRGAMGPQGLPGPQTGETGNGEDSQHRD